jgi:hypothetical protein
LAIEKRLKKRGRKAPDWIRRWAEQQQLSPLERLFSRVPLMLSLFGHKVAPGDTAAEQLAALTALIDPQSAAVADEFLDLYQKGLFSPYPVDLAQARNVYIKLWWSVLAALVKRWRGV